MLKSNFYFIGMAGIDISATVPVFHYAWLLLGE